MSDARSTPTLGSEPPRDVLDDTVPAPDSNESSPAAPPASGAETAARPRTSRPTIPGDRYRLGAELGRGGMGRVVEAFDAQLNRTVAYKEVLARGGSNHTRRFAREVQLTARLEHPSIVPLYDSGITGDGRPFYVMRRVSGRPLADAIAGARGLDERLTLVPAVLAAIDAVAHAHRRGVIHRDLKPANILVGELGETVVIDWGLAKVIGETEDDDGAAPAAGDSLQTQIGAVFGTPGFMAPEQARGEELGTQGDVYALGATLYHVLAGTPPHKGPSATAVMESTHKHEIVPLAEAAPGCPPELIAIVDKALSFEQRTRYADAGALAEDLRRFLAGQLVAAHRYTSAQRLARFARRHRAALSVAAIAAVAVAVMAWIGVARIVSERDAARAAREDAVAGRRVAEEARGELEARRDLLLVTRARGLLDANPTEALAALAQLPPGSARVDEARAIAQGAAMRGVAWALESAPGFSPIAALDADGVRLLQISGHGVVSVWDLERRRQLVARPYERGVRGLWVADGRVLVLPRSGPPELLDPAAGTGAGTATALALPPLAHAVATDRGDRVLARLADGGAAIVDVAARTHRVLAGPRATVGVTIAPDGAWLVVLDPAGAHVFDGAGAPLGRRAGKFSLVAGSRHRRFALHAEGSARDVTECRLDPAFACAPIDTATLGNRQVMTLAYRDAELSLVAGMAVYGWSDGALRERARLTELANGIHEARGALVWVEQGKLHHLHAAGRGAIAVPIPFASSFRIAASETSSRVALVGDGAIMVFELDAVRPEQIAGRGVSTLFVDDEVVLRWSQGSPWQLVDLRGGGVRAELPYDRVRAEPLQTDRAGRVVIRSYLDARTERLDLVRVGSGAVSTIVEGERAWALLLPGDAVIFGAGDGGVHARVGGAPAREVARLDDRVISTVALGGPRFAVQSAAGEIVRSDLATGAVERTRVVADAGGFLASDGAGRVLVVRDNRVFLWHGALVDLGRFDRPIHRVEPCAGGVAVTLADREVHLLEVRPGGPAHRLLQPAGEPPQLSSDGTRLVGVGAGNQLVAIELPSRARWTLPIARGAPHRFALSPDGRTLLDALSDDALARWPLPRATPDLTTWLADHTNAALDPDQALIWPWQAPRGP